MTRVEELLKEYKSISFNNGFFLGFCTGMFVTSLTILIVSKK